MEPIYSAWLYVFFDSKNITVFCFVLFIKMQIKNKEKLSTTFWKDLLIPFGAARFKCWTYCKQPSQWKRKILGAPTGTEHGHWNGKPNCKSKLTLVLRWGSSVVFVLIKPPALHLNPAPAWMGSKRTTYHRLLPWLLYAATSKSFLVFWFLSLPF